MIYLDYNATHPPIGEIIEKNYRLYYENWANPSGISFFSQKNFKIIEDARSQIQKLLEQFYDYPNANIVFTSTGTESVHQMIYSFIDTSKPYAIVSPYEHECFYAACESFGLKTIILPASEKGMLNPEDIDKVMKQNQLKPDDISFIGCIAVSNETGIIQPIHQISEIARSLQIPLISDTIQLVGKYPINLEYLDAFTINGHKIGAGFGISAVIFRNRHRIRSLFKGGLQEHGFRAGTENFVAIKNLSDAFQWQMENQEKYTQLKEFQQYLENFLENECSAIIVGKSSPRLPHVIYAIFPKLKDLDFVLISLDQEQIVCSTGSSCKSRTRQPSETLLRMGFSKEMSLQALRFSFGIFTQKEEIEVFSKKFINIYKSLHNV